ncbi:hypothetical protein ATKI12_6390 [Kitasatospora sp. Ki12]
MTADRTVPGSGCAARARCVRPQPLQQAARSPARRAPQDRPRRHARSTAGKQRRSCGRHDDGRSTVTAGRRRPRAGPGTGRSSGVRARTPIRRPRGGRRPSVRPAPPPAGPDVSAPAVSSLHQRVRQDDDQAKQCITDTDEQRRQPGTPTGPGRGQAPSRSMPGGVSEICALLINRVGRRCTVALARLAAWPCATRSCRPSWRARRPVTT